MITIFNLAVTIADVMISSSSFFLAFLSVINPVGHAEMPVTNWLLFCLFLVHLTDFIILLAVPKRSLSEPKVQWELNLKGVERDWRADYQNQKHF